MLDWAACGGGAGEDKFPGAGIWVRQIPGCVDLDPVNRGSHGCFSTYCIMTKSFYLTTIFQISVDEIGNLLCCAQLFFIAGASTVNKVVLATF